ncbi:MAG TPA: RodZ domain-containing protein [Anaerolineae bacterium]|nr:RodZ domain-containing protein [Anaerolineae bacterium]
MQTEAIGEVLAEARRELGKSIKEVELGTKIRSRYIEALERDDFESLPGDIYAKGFIKTYAIYLGLDPRPLIQQYKGLYEQQNSYDVAHMSANMRIATKKRPRWFKPIIGFGIVAAIFIVLIAWGALQSGSSNKQPLKAWDIRARGNTDTTVAATTTSTTHKRAVIGNEETDSDNAEPRGDAVSDQEKHTTSTTIPDSKTTDNGKTDVTVKLTGINDTGSWVRVKVDGENKFEGLITDGESKLFKADETIQVRVGNAPGLEVMYNGKRLPQLETVNGVAVKTFTKESSSGER